MNRFIVTFVIACVLLASFSLVPFVLTSSAPSYDGSQFMGFPLVFSSHGGLCFDTGMEWESFYIANLIIDAVIVLVFSALAGYFVKKYFPGKSLTKTN